MLAIFDRYDNVDQFYVNGPGGQVAVYKDNDQSYLYYFIKDHLGSTRVMIDRNNAAVQFVNYHPFGEIIESWSSYDEPLKFTSKERDLNSSFDYYYFGSRYYDQRIGQFASVDKAGQFPGGYLYGGANPLIGVDPDGNFFLVDDIIAGVIGGAINLVTNWGNINNFWDGLGYFGIGFAGGVLSMHPEIGGPIWAGMIMGGGNAAMQGGNILQGAAIGGIAGAAGWGAAGIGGKICNSPIINGAVKGAIGGAVGGFAAGTAAGMFSGLSMDDALALGLNSSLKGAVMGAMVGAGAASANAIVKGINPLTGKPMFDPPKPSNQKGGVWPNNKGKAGVARAEIDLPEHGIKIIGRQIHVRIGDRIRIYDLAGFENGKFVLIEVKNGPFAAYKPNQNACNSYIVEGVKPIPFGNMAAEAGFDLGLPANVKIITVWYKGENEIYIDIINGQY